MFSRTQAGPGSPLVFCQRRREIREKDASKAKLQKQGFWAMEWRGPFRVERAAAHSIQPLSSLHSTPAWCRRSSGALASIAERAPPEEEESCLLSLMRR